MKFSVRVDGADSGLIERLVSTANRKLAPKLKRIAAHHAIVQLAQAHRKIGTLARSAGSVVTAPASISNGTAPTDSPSAEIAADTTTAIEVSADATPENITVFDILSDPDLQ